MAGGCVDAPGVSHERAQQYQGRVTFYVVFACMVAAIGGSIFGYDIGISGGVTSMDDFLQKFFPAVYHRKHYENDHDSDYCKYNNQGLAMFTSSLYIAGLLASVGASHVTRRYGRKASIVSGGICFLVGAALNAGAISLGMLIIGRIMLGVGIGFANQAVPLYLSELAPPKFRGGLNIMFQLATTLGIFTANMVNYGTQHIKTWGWRLSLGLAAGPALLMTVGGMFLPDTPNSLIERGHLEKGRAVLEEIRGTRNVEAEYEDMVDAAALAKSIRHPFRNILERRNRPQLVMAICMPMFQILTGINSILFYAPVLFGSLGFGANASLYSPVRTGAVLVASTLVSIAAVDRWGRRALLLSGGIQMIVCKGYSSKKIEHAFYIETRNSLFVRHETDRRDILLGSPRFRWNCESIQLRCTEKFGETNPLFHSFGPLSHLSKMEEFMCRSSSKNAVFSGVSLWIGRYRAGVICSS